MDTFQICLEKYAEFGQVEEIYHPVAMAAGLPGVFPQELVVFENNQKGQVLSMGRNRLEILTFSREPVKAGMRIARTGKVLSVPMGDYLLGQVIDPLGKPLAQAAGMVHTEEEREIDIPPTSILTRAVIDEPLVTGIAMVDMLLPLGKGQREMITGDRKTGKSAFLLSVLRSQIEQGSLVVFAAIGKKAIEIEQYRNYFEKQHLMSHMVLVSASTLDAQSMVYIAPYTAMTIAEYFRDLGKDVLIILDDLSTHAKFYREISLLARRFPGRDSYPGDIFYTHARLLERAGNYRLSNRAQAAITCLPVAETVENELTDYIVSNLISITDGHLLFDSNEFIKGRRPSINPTLSVTRVGKQTQTSLHQDMNQQLMNFLGIYAKNQQLSHFGAELTDEVKLILNKGERLYAFFNQATGMVIPLTIQMVMIAMLWLDWFKVVSPHGVRVSRSRMVHKYQTDITFKKLLDSLINVAAYKDLLQNVTENQQLIWKVCQTKMIDK